MLLRARMPSPAWGAPDQRVASMGGFSWSYGELPQPTSTAVVGSSGALAGSGPETRCCCCHARSPA